MSSIYILYSEIYYEPLYKTYFNILSLNKEPHGELNKYTKHIRVTSPSTKEETLVTSYCTYAISTNLLNTTNHNSSINIMRLEELEELTQFILNNNYVINDVITQMYKSVLPKTNNKRIIYAFN